MSVGGVSLKVMDLSASQEFTPRLEYLPEIGSTNTYLLELANSFDVPDFSVVVTDNQTAGRGRMDRVWEADKGKALAVSVYLKPENISIEAFSWFPLLSGIAMQKAVSSLIPVGVSLKWPNDVLVNGEKISGILAELLPDGKSVVVGAGLNLTQEKAELPIPTATSLVLQGVTGFSLDDVLVRYLAALKNLYLDFCEAGGDPESSGLLDQVLAVSSTVGREVEVMLPDGSVFSGHAAGLDNQGRLLVALSNPVEIRAVAAGDIKHLRQ